MGEVMGLYDLYRGRGDRRKVLAGVDGRVGVSGSELPFQSPLQPWR